MVVPDDHEKKTLPLTLDEWQWTARDEYSANTIMKDTLGGGHAKGGFSARQNVTSIAGRRWESFILRYAVDLYVQDPIGIIFWMEGTDGGTD